LHFERIGEFFSINILIKIVVQGNLKYAISFLPLARSSAMMPFYGGLDGVKISDGRTQIVAMDLGKLN